MAGTTEGTSVTPPRILLVAQGDPEEGSSPTSHSRARTTAPPPLGPASLFSRALGPSEDRGPPPTASVPDTENQSGFPSGPTSTHCHTSHRPSVPPGPGPRH